METQEDTSLSSNKKKYIPLKDLEVYQLARKISALAWDIYEKLHWQDRKVMGDQFIESADSVGANIAEGYNRYHFLERIKFYYNSRASLAEACEHWLELLFERKKITTDVFETIKSLDKTVSVKLNNFIGSTFRAKDKQ